jgi:hypothetical protein
MSEEHDVRRKVSPELMDRVEREPDDSSEIPVIVTLAPGTDPAAVEAKGMRIDHVIDNAPLVIGTVAGANVTGLADLGEVERVEYDGRMRGF